MPPPLNILYRAFCRFNFDEVVIAFEATRTGKSDDGKGVIKAIISEA